jgi:hypothetical protein
MWRIQLNLSGRFVFLYMRHLFKTFTPLQKRKKIGYAPTPRSGCTMALWAARSTGVMFGGVFDEDTSEETLDSVFYQDM